MTDATTAQVPDVNLEAAGEAAELVYTTRTGEAKVRL